MNKDFTCDVLHLQGYEVHVHSHLPTNLSLYSLSRSVSVEFVAFDADLCSLSQLDHSLSLLHS